MEFVRKNLFLIIVGAVVLVVGGGMIFLKLGADDETDKKVALRTAASQSLQSLARSKISRQVVEAERTRVETVQGAAKKVAEACIEWNRKNYPVLSVTPRDSTKAIPAFPVDEKQYETLNLKYDVTQTYYKELVALLEPLGRAVPPTEAEIEDEIIVQTKIIRDQLNRERLHAIAAGKEPPPDPGAGTVGAKARKKASDVMRLKKASEGMIYASEASLDVVFPDPDPLAPFEKLWQAQVNLWVTRDILAAIQAVNTTATKGAAQKNVLTSGIKRLLKIEVQREYVKGKDEGGTPGAARGRPGSSGLPTIKNLTGRVCSQQVDVLHYSFTVIMPTKYVLLLQKELMNRNFHTVLGVQMATVVQNPEDMHYYGTDPIMEVTIEGELLLLTAWERGTWDEKSKTWTRPALMPRQMLDTLDKSSLRAEDRKRTEDSK